MLTETLKTMITLSEGRRKMQYSHPADLYRRELLLAWCTLNQYILQILQDREEVEKSCWKYLIWFLVWLLPQTFWRMPQTKHHWLANVLTWMWLADLWDSSIVFTIPTHVFTIAAAKTWSLRLPKIHYGISYLMFFLHFLESERCPATTRSA